MRSLIGRLEWKEGKVSGGEVTSLKDALLGLDCVTRNQGKNLMLFFYSQEKITIRSSNPKAKPRVKVTPQAQLTTNAVKKAFNTESYKTIIGSEFFECYEINVTGIAPQQNRWFYSALAPLVVLIDKTGKIQGLLSRQQITESAVFAVMAKIVAADRVNLASAVAAATGTLRAVYASEHKRFSANSNHKKASATYSKKRTTTNKRRMDLAKMVADKYQKQKEAYIARFHKIMEAAGLGKGKLAMQR